jgi:hypothetical protein
LTQRKIRISFNSEQGQEYATVGLTARVTAMTSLSVFPESLDLGSVIEGTKAAQTLFVRGDPEALSRLPEELVWHAEASEAVAIDFGRPTRTPSLRSVIVRFHPESTPTTLEVHGILKLHDTSEFGAQDIVVPVRAKVLPEIQAIPRRIALFFNPNTESKTEFRLLWPSGSRMPRLKAETDLPVRCEMGASQEPNRISAEVVIDPARLSNIGDLTGSIAIVDSDSAAVLIRVPIAIVSKDVPGG